MNRFYNNSYEGPQGDFNNMDGFDQDEFPWDNPMPGLMDRPMYRNRRDMRKARYDNAYGDYRGGYGPGGGYGPRPLMPPPPPSLMPPPPSMMPPPPRGGMWGRGIGPRGPPRRNLNDDRAIKYLMRCGVPKDCMKNLPHDLLALIQPEHCGLCDFSFDSFAISRMHYISKNHLKNQKKWLSKTNGGSLQEMPFKARNLYCELCDIPITSTAHGDAHYAGKPHRGIVDGRKKPKNPLLLQNGMERRLEQLIRREKRFLKPLENEKVKTDAAETPQAQNAKIVSPELYCNICKTTVTCSDQMTMHMNGKKHLAKEKHHILTMMKGDSGTKNEPEEEVYEEEEEENQFHDEDVVMGDSKPKPDDGNVIEIPDDKGEGDADADDWGNEAWDQETTAKAQV